MRLWEQSLYALIKVVQVDTDTVIVAFWTAMLDFIVLLLLVLLLLLFVLLLILELPIFSAKISKHSYRASVCRSQPYNLLGNLPLIILGGRGEGTLGVKGHNIIMNMNGL